MFFVRQPNWRAYLKKLTEKPKLLAVFITAPTPALGATDAQMYFADRHTPAQLAGLRRLRETLVVKSGIPRSGEPLATD